MYSTRTRVHARIPNGHPREEKRASDKSSLTVGEQADCRARRTLTSARGSSRGSRRGSPCRSRGI